MKNQLLKNLLNLSKIESDINEHLPLMTILCTLMKPKTIVELGVRAGVSTQAFLAYVEANNDSRLYSYDIRDVCSESYYKNCGILERFPKAKNFDFWNFEIGDSLKVHNKWEDNSIDILFIDTKHKPEQLRLELESWHKKVKSNGIIIMHDVVLKKAKLKIGITQFQEKHPSFKYMECDYNYGLGILYQPIEWIETLLKN